MIHNISSTGYVIRSLDARGGGDDVMGGVSGVCGRREERRDRGRESLQ